jgi:hypothetical protein
MFTSQTAAFKRSLDAADAAAPAGADKRPRHVVIKAEVKAEVKPEAALKWAAGALTSVEMKVQCCSLHLLF